MTAKDMTALGGAAILATSCGCSHTAVKYSAVNNYFVRNDAPADIPATYTSQVAFDSIFGAAAFMGKGGRPTAIDWNRQIAIAKVLPETDTPTTIEVRSIQAGADSTLHITYDIHRAPAPASYTMRPCTVVAIDRRYSGYRLQEGR